MMLCMNDILKHDELTGTGYSIKQSAMDKGYINTTFLDNSTEMAHMLVRTMYELSYVSVKRQATLFKCIKHSLGNSLFLQFKESNINDAGHK